MSAEPTVSCPHAADCAGCPLIDLPADEQRSLKEARVARGAARFASLAAVEIEPLRRAEPEVGYRTRAKLVVAPGPRLGLYARRGDHVVVDIPECRVLRPALRDVAAALRALLAAPPAEASPVLRAPVLRAVDLREALAPEGAVRVLVTIVLDAAAVVPPSALPAAAEAIAQRAPAAAAVAVSFQAADAPQLLGRDLRLLFGPPALPDRLGDDPELPFVHATHGGFVQVHRGQAARIRALVSTTLDGALGGLGGRAIVDAYAGSGATGLALAAAGARVILIEAHPGSAEQARAAAALQHLDAVEIARADVADGLEALRSAVRPIDAIVLNPPRRGASPRVRALSAALARTAILYVSCDPDTLGRDLDAFTRLGWATDALVPFDMIPQTAEVETVALLLRRPPPAPVVLYADDELVAVDKPAHERTVPSAEVPCLQARLRALPGLEAAVALTPLDAGTSGVCLFARTPAAVPALAEALSADGASAEYEALCRGRTRPELSLPPARLRRLREIGGHSLVAVRAPPGGTRSLRRALARRGHPILGDDKDGHAASNRHLLERCGLDRPFLHCARVSLVHPRSGAPVVVSSSLAGELTLVLDRLAGA